MIDHHRATYHFQLAANRMNAPMIWRCSRVESSSVTFSIPSDSSVSRHTGCLDVGFNLVTLLLSLSTKPH